MKQLRILFKKEFRHLYKKEPTNLCFLCSHSALSARKTISMASHTNTCTTCLTRAILALSDDLAIFHLVELQYRELHELVLVTNLLGLGVHLLLSLLSTTTKTKHQVKSGLLLNVVVRESAAILELLAGEDQTLLIRGNTFLVLDLLLDIINAI